MAKFDHYPWADKLPDATLDVSEEHYHEFFRTMFERIFCAECTISAALFQWKTPPRFRMALPGLFYPFLYKKAVLR